MNQEKFIEKVTPLFIQKGFRSLTVDEICIEFGMSKKTVYNLFKSKKDMIGASFEYVLDKFQNFFLFSNSKSETAVESFFTLLCLINSYFPYDKQRMNLHEMQYYYRKLYQEKMGNAQDLAFNMFYAFCAAGREQGIVREDFNIDSQSYLFSAVYMDLISTDYLNPDENYSKTIMDNIEISIRGVLNQQGFNELLNPNHRI